MPVTTETVTISLPDGAQMGGYLARPDEDGPHPTIIVWMEIFGVNSHIRDVTTRIASEGYLALAPDFFHRTGPGIELNYDDDGFAKGFKHKDALVAEQMIDDARASLTFLRSRPDVQDDRIGVIGFCIGGHMTYLTACETDVIAAASFYGGGIAAPQGPGGAQSTVSRTSKIQGRIICFFGAKDEHIPMDQVDEIQQALNDARTDSEIVVYDDADHGFFCDQRATYHEFSAKNAWSRVRDLFRDKLKV